MNSQRYGGSGGRGRRIADLEEQLIVEKGLVRGSNEDSRRKRRKVGMTATIAGAASPLTFTHGRRGLAVDSAAMLGGMGLSLANTEKPKRRVAKARYYDPEHARQRRIGMGQAALLLGGGALGFRGGRGLLRTTRGARAIAGVTGRDVEQVRDLRAALKTGVAVTRRDLAQLGGAGAALTGAESLRQHANSRRGRAYD